MRVPKAKWPKSSNNPSVWKRIYEHQSPAFFLVGYGSGRRTERPEGYSEQSRSPRYQRIASLFEDQVGLTPFTYAYLQLQIRQTLTEARTLLNELLAEEHVSLSTQQDEQDRPLFDNDGLLLPFDALSDGFRAFIGWIWDLLLQMSRILPYDGTTLKELTGVVIVDEIDLFLHPEWQQRIVGHIAHAFPKIQFLFSTHSPLVAGTLESQNLYVLQTDGNDNSAIVEQYPENICGLTANQILTSAYFGLRSTRASGAPEETLARLALSENAGDHQQFLRLMAGSVPNE